MQFYRFSHPISLSQVNFSKNQAHAHEILSLCHDPIEVRIGHGSQVKLTARCKSSTSTSITALSCLRLKLNIMAIGHCNGSLVMISLIYIFMAQPRESGVRSRAIVSSFIYSIILLFSVGNPSSHVTIVHFH